MVSAEGGLRSGEKLLSTWQQGPNKLMLNQWQFMPVRVTGFMVAPKQVRGFAPKGFDTLEISEHVLFAPV